MQGLVNERETPSQADAPLRVLLIEDSEDDAELLVRALRKGGLDLEWARVETEPDLRAALAGKDWQLVISDYTLPRLDALQALRTVQDCGHDIPFIIASGTIAEDTAVEVMRAGAHDYIMKGNTTRLVAAIERELREVEVRRQRRHAEEERKYEAQVNAALAQVGREIIATMNTAELAERLCQLTTRLLEADCSHSFLLGAEPDEYLLMGAHGSSPEERETLKAPRLLPSTIEEILDRVGPDDVMATESEDAARAPLPRLLAHHGMVPSLVVALRRGSDLFGLHVVSRRRGAPPFSPGHRRVLSGIAQLASVALENRRLFEALERANRMKSEFVATMSHELRTPLHIIMGYNTLLIEGTLGGAESQQNAYRRIDRSARRLLELIESTLDLSRLEAGRAPLQIESVDPRALIEQLRSDVSAMMEPRHSLEIRWTVEDDLPALRTDPVKLRVILRNLIDNAVKFSERGSVHITATKLEETLLFVVEDTGIGIAPEIRPYIFDAFHQGDSSATRRYDGVGLGLYIARQMAHLIGARLDYESEVGRGTTFRLHLLETARES